MKVFVGWGHVPTGAGTTNCVQACLCRLSAAYADGGDMSPPYRGCFVYHGAFSRVDCEERSDTAISCRNHRLRTNLFAPAVCRCADGTPRSLAQPSATKEPYGCGMPLADTCPTNFDRTLAVGRDDSARRCRNYQMRTNSPPMSLRGRLRPWQSRAGTTVCVQTYLPLPSAAARTARRGRRALRP